MPIAITPKYDVVDNPTVNLDGAATTASVVVDGVTYVIAGGFRDSGLSVFSLGANGALTPVFNVSDDATLQLNSVSSLTTATIGGVAYLYAAGFQDSGISVFQVNVDGSLSSVQNVVDSAETLLANPYDLALATVGARSFLYAAALGEAGLSIFEIGSDGALTHVGNVGDGDDPFYLLSSVVGVSVGMYEGDNYLIATGPEGVSVFLIAADGLLTQTDARTGADSGPVTFSTMVDSNGFTFVGVTSAGDNSLDLYVMESGGRLLLLDHWVDTVGENLSGAASIVSATISGRTYLGVSGNEGVSFFEIGGDLRLSLASNLDAPGLSGSINLGLATVDDHLFLLAVSDGSNNLETFSLTDNQPLVMTGDAQIEVDEGYSVTITADDLGYSDADQVASGIVYTIESLDVGTIRLNGVAIGVGDTFTQADIDNGLLVYAHDGSEPVDIGRLRYTVTDGQGDTRSNLQLTISIAGGNDAGVLDLNGNDPGIDAVAEWSIGGSPVILAPVSRLTDVDTPSLGGGTLTVAITGNASAGDVLGVTSVGAIIIDGNDVYSGVNLIAHFTGGTNGAPLVFSFIEGSGASPFVIRPLLRGITFTNGSATPSTDTRTITFTTKDALGTEHGGQDTATANVVLTITEPHGPHDADVTATMFEDTYANSVTLIVYDDDSTNPVSFNLTGLPDHGMLYDAGSNQLFTGTPMVADHYDSALGAWVLTLRFAGDGNWSGQTSFTYNATTSGGFTTDGATATLNVTPVADAPYVIRGIGNPPTVADTPRNVSNSSTVVDSVPVIVSLDNGQSLVVWQAASTNIRGRYYNADGTPSGSAFDMTPSTGATEIQPAVAARPGGGFALTYVTSGNSGNIVTQFYTDGATSPSATVTTASTAAREIDPTVTQVGTGYVVTWATEVSGATQINAQRYTSAGVAVGSSFVAVTGADRSGTGASFDPPNHKVAEVGSSGAFVVITEHGTDLHATLVRANGTTLALGNVNTSTELADQASVTQLVDGGFVVVWRQTEGSDQTVYSRVYDANGVAISQPLGVVNLFGNEVSPQVAALADGGFAVVWTGIGLDSTRDIFVQTYAADGSEASQGSNDITYTGGSISESAPTISVGADGLMNVAWINNRGAGNREDVMYAQLIPSPSRVEGNSGHTVQIPSYPVLSDGDGSEALASVVITNVPTGFSFQAGARDPNDATHWIIDRSDPASAQFLDDLATFDYLDLTTTRGYNGTFTMSVTFTTYEKDNPSSTASTTVAVPVHLVTVPNEAPVLDLDPDTAGVDAATIWVEGDGPLQLAYFASFTDDNGSSYNGATVTAAFTANGKPGDLLSIYSSGGDGTGQLRIQGQNVYYEGNLVGTFTGGSNGTPLVVTFNALACHCAIQMVIGNITFNTENDAPDTATRRVTVTLVDGLGTDGGGHDTASADVYVTITPTDDLATTVHDIAQIGENNTTTLDVLGNDSDPDSVLRVAMIAGQAVVVGGSVTLPSGAIVTLNVDGTLHFNPNGAYAWLITDATALATGASNSGATESFTYTLSDGVIGTVDVSVRGETSAGDQLVGSAGADTITGTAAADYINGGAGADTMRGGAGDDIYIVDNSADVVTELAYGGTDSVYASASFTLVGYVENLTLTGNGTINGTGNSLANIITGNSAANTLSGGDGNDVLNGAGGADTMIGGAGDDSFYVDQVGDLAVEASGQGNDTVYASITYSLVGQYIERLILTGGAAINGTGNSLANILIGNAANNTLDGGDGNDDIDGGLGIDTMIGGLGDDVFHVDQVGDLAVEAANGGYDTVRASITYSLAGQYVEALILTGSAAINGTGNKYANALTGNSAANTLDGGEGNDIIDGGGGADTMIGGLGDDIFYVDQVGDLAVEANGQGNDTVYASINYTLSGQFVDNLILTGTGAISGTGNKLDNHMTGNGAANTLNGGEGNDTIDGGAGADTMAGGLGDDVFYVDNVGDVVIELANSGYDKVYSSVSFSLSGQYIEDLTLTGSADIDATGNKFANVIIGNSGANQIHGGLGADTLTGGAGADGFYFDTALGGGNIDTITDFNVAADTIYLDRAIFDGIGADGDLSTDAFAYGTDAQTADVRILYDPATGKIYYDADGNGAGAAIEIAHVTAGTALTNADFHAFSI